MTLLEILIVYSAIGAPFGAHYYLTRGAATPHLLLCLRAAAAGSGWAIYAAFLLVEAAQNKRRARATNCAAAANAILDATAQAILTAANDLLANKNGLSFFEFRETLERYAGLTETVNDLNFEQQPTTREKEIFRIIGRDKAAQQLGARIVQRRNEQRLRQHQIIARQDFARAIKQTNQLAATNDAARDRFERAVLRLATILNDAEAVEAFKKSFEIRQTAALASVEKTLPSEQKIWKTELKKRQFPALRAQAASAGGKTTRD